MAEMIKKKNHKGEDVEILGATYEEGKPEALGYWRHKLVDRQQMLAFLKSAERYWYSDEWFGSERRKNPA